MLSKLPANRGHRKGMSMVHKGTQWAVATLAFVSVATPLYAAEFPDCSDVAEYASKADFDQSVPINPMDGSPRVSAALASDEFRVLFDKTFIAKSYEEANALVASIEGCREQSTNSNDADGLAAMSQAIGDSLDTLHAVEVAEKRAVSTLAAIVEERRSSWLMRTFNAVDDGYGGVEALREISSADDEAVRQHARSYLETLPDLAEDRLPGLLADNFSRRAGQRRDEIMAGFLEFMQSLPETAQSLEILENQREHAALLSGERAQRLTREIDRRIERISQVVSTGGG